MTSALSVSQLLAKLNRQLSQDLGSCWVRGEISQLTPSGRGHLYFSLKDPQAVLRAVIWASRIEGLEFAPSEGVSVLAWGQLSVYPARGQLQFTCQQLLPDGIGQYFLALEQLRKRLLAEGLFEVSRKRPLPFFPTRVGVVTSQEGAVWQDIQTTLLRRNPAVQLILAPSLVQGASAVGQLQAALQRLLEAKVEVVILARGGGSWEDLMAFNHERLVRFLSHYPLPLITAIGHESDTCLCDLVADQRAATPTAAAELVAPELAQLSRDLASQRQRLQQGLVQLLEGRRQALSHLCQRPWQHQPQNLWQQPSWRLERLGRELREALQQLAYRHRSRLEQLDRKLDPQRLLASTLGQAQHLRHLDQQLGKQLPRALVQGQQRLNELKELLQTLSPQRVLERGYSLCVDASGRPITSVVGRKAQDQLEIRLSDGRLHCSVGQVSPAIEDTTRERISQL